VPQEMKKKRGGQDSLRHATRGTTEVRNVPTSGKKEMDKEELPTQDAHMRGVDQAVATDLHGPFFGPLCP